MQYIDFLRSKIDIAPDAGIEISPDEVNPILKPHERDTVLWMCRGGRRANFSSFGLGKTLEQLEVSRLMVKHFGGQALIVLPLGVKQEFRRDAVELLGIEAPQYVRNMDEVRAAAGSILLTNYERVRDGDIDPTYFTVTNLDEAAVLRSYGSKTYQTFLDKFKGVRFKFANTATPAPNRYKEMIHYAGFLEIMDTGQALTRFFQRDSSKANNLTLYPHKEKEFYLWLSSWALFVTKPSDLSYSDDGYILPPMEVRYHRIEVQQAAPVTDRDGQMKIMRDASVSLADAMAIKKDTIGERVNKAAEIVNANPEDHFILWHDLEEERRAIKRALPEAVDIYGSQDLDLREQRVIDFSEGRSRLFATKKELSGSGCNFQRHCHRAIFVGIDYEFNDFIQAIHRIYRFLQSERVIIDIIYTDGEDQILRVLLEKWKQYEELTGQMTEIIRKHGLSNPSMMEKLARSIGVDRVEIKSEHFTAVNNDCVLELEQMPDNSMGAILTSIPFGNHYEYSASYNDFGYNESDGVFFDQMDYLTPQLLRVLKPGRIAGIHVKDRILFGNVTGDGFPSVEPFSDMTVAHFIKHGFRFIGRIPILTDVVRENAQTYRLGWTEQCKDASKMGVGCPEYLLLLRKLPSDTSNGYADEPVVKAKTDYQRSQWQIDAHAFWRSSGDRFMTKDELKAIPVDKLQAAYRKYSRENVYSYEEHVALAKELDISGKLPASFMVVAPGSWDDSIWDDINRMNTLNKDQRLGRRELHVCPLQIDIVDRFIIRFTNEGDDILDPFAGIFTVPVRAIKHGRRGYGIELNTDYFRDGVGYCQAEEDKRDMPTLFDLEMVDEAG
jgi:DNA modification methylase